MNLLTDSTGLTVDKLEILKSHKIFTSLDFVQANNDKLASWISCNVSEVIKTKEKILASNNSKPMRADKLCDLRLQSTVMIESGIQTLDHLLGGGIQSGRITEIYGDSGSGKTQFALQLSANAALKQQHRVSYLTSGETNCQRILQIMECLDKDGDFNGSLQRITFTHLSDVFTLFQALWSPEMTSCKLLVLDSLATLFLPILGDSSNDAISYLNRVASDLKRLSVVHQCAVLVINHVSGWKGDASTSSYPIPFLGRYWYSVPNLRLYSKHLGPDQFELSIVRNVYYPNQEGKCTFGYFNTNPTTSC